MKRNQLVKKGLALALAAVLCAQSSMAYAEEFSSAVAEGGAVVVEAEPGQEEGNGEAEEPETFVDVPTDELSDEAEEGASTAGTDIDETEIEDAGENEGEEAVFSSGEDEKEAQIESDESADTVMEGWVYGADGVTWRLDSNGVFYLEGSGKISGSLACVLKGESASSSSDIDIPYSAYSIHTLVIGEQISGWLTYECLPTKYSELKSLIIRDRAETDNLTLGGGWQNASKLENVSIGSGITSIPSFKECTSLKTITIPSGLTEIKEKTFDDCTSLEEIVIPGSVQTIGEWAFAGCSSLKSLVISNGVKSIGRSAFSGCTSLKEVVIPDSVTTYGEYAFSGCTALKKIVLSKNASEISNGMFGSCKNLTDITIPEGVTMIGEYAFEDISTEANLVFPNSVTTICEMSKLPSCTIKMPCRFAYDGTLHMQDSYSFYHMNGVSDSDEDNCTVCKQTGSCGTDSSYAMTLSGKLTISGRGSAYFDGLCVENSASNGDITSLIVEDGIYYVDLSLYSYSELFSRSFNNLQTITLADSVKEATIYGNSTSLKTITIGKSLEKDFSFGGFSNLENIIISDENPNYVNKDGVIFSKDGTRLVFYTPNRQGEEYTIPAEVTQIYMYAFSGSQNLKRIVVPATVQALDGGSGYFKLNGCKNLEEIVLNNTVNKIPSNFCSSSEALSSMVIPEGADSIGYQAFRLCRNLKTITIPTSVRRIESRAFDGCSSLTTVHYLGTEEQWKEITIESENEYLTEGTDIHYCTVVQDNTTTCDSAGSRVYSCAVCGTTFTVNVPKTTHAYSDWEVTREATCAQAGEETATCSICKDVKTRPIEKKYHQYSSWVTIREATCVQAGERTSTCSVCGDVKHITTEKGGHQYSYTYEDETVFTPYTAVARCTVCGYEKRTEYGSPLSPTISLNTKSITLQVKQATTCVKVENLAKGDAVKSWKSSNTKIVKVTNSGKIIAQKKTGKAKVTVTLLSGKKATITVKVQKNAIVTQGMSITTSSKLKLKVKKKLTLKPTLYPLTSSQKITYTSSNKKVAAVSKSGVVTAKKKGKAVITIKSGNVKLPITITVK